MFTQSLLFSFLQEKSLTDTENIAFNDRPEILTLTWQIIEEVIKPLPYNKGSNQGLF